MELETPDTIVIDGEALVCDPTLACEAPALTRFLAVWNAHAQGGGIPLRMALSARVLKPHLPNLLLIERTQESEEARRYRVRLVGTRLARVIGDVTGQFIDEFVPEKLRPRWYGTTDRVLAALQPLRFMGRVLLHDRTYLMAEYISAPLADDQGRPTMVLTAFAITNANMQTIGLQSLAS